MVSHRHVGVDVLTTREHTVSMRDPGYDETDMTLEEFNARVAEARCVREAQDDDSGGLNLVIIRPLEAPFRTGTRSETRREDVRLAGDQTIRAYRAFADT